MTVPEDDQFAPGLEVGVEDGPRFNDGKEPGALRTIGEVTKALGIRQHVLRYWEEQFPLLRPIKRSGGRRYYRPEDIALIAEINRLVHQEGYTLRGAKAALAAATPRGRKAGAAAAAIEPLPVSAEVTPQASAPARNTIDELRAIRDDLAEALAQA